MEESRKRDFVEKLSGSPLKWQAIPLVENVYKTIDRFKLLGLALTFQSTVRQTIDGAMRHPTDNYAIFVVFQQGTISRFVLRALDQLNKRGFNVLICSNAKLLPAQERILLSNCHSLTYRRNIGRDFGAYKDVALRLQKDCRRAGKEIQRLVLINDSLYFFEENLDHLFAQICNSEREFIGAFENFELQYHVGSFLIGIGSRPLKHPRFWKFWRSYEPLSTRRHSINQGEVGLTKVLRRCGCQPEVAYSTLDIFRRVQNMSVTDLLRLTDVMPKHYRWKYGDDYVWRLIDEQLAKVDPDAPSKAVVPIRMPNASFLNDIKTMLAPPISTQNYSNVISGDISPDTIRYKEDAKSRAIATAFGVDTLTLNSILEKRVREGVSQAVTEFVFSQSQIHNGAGLWVMLRAPIMKRDIVFRGQYEFYEMDRLLSHLEEDERKEILNDMRARGHPYSLPPWPRLLWHWGFL